jgi:hypothetical protein
VVSVFACLLLLPVVPDVLVLHVFVVVVTAAVVVSSHIGPASSGPFTIVFCPSQLQCSFFDLFGMQEP